MAFTAAQMREHRRIRKERRQCTDCGADLPQGWKLLKCERCHTRNSIRQQELRARRRSAGKCQYCNEPVMAGKSNCCIKHSSISRRYNREARVRAKKEGRCTCCHNPIDEFSLLSGRTTCTVCQDRDKWRRLH